MSSPLVVHFETPAVEERVHGPDPPCLSRLSCQSTYILMFGFNLLMVLKTEESSINDFPCDSRQNQRQNKFRICALIAPVLTHRLPYTLLPSSLHPVSPSLQNLVLLNSGKRDIVPEALECVGAADVFVSSDDEFSQAAELLSGNVKVLTDRWQVDRGEKMVALNVANTIAGMAHDTRAQLFKMVKEWRECSLSSV